MQCASQDSEETETALYCRSSTANSWEYLPILTETVVMHRIKGAESRTFLMYSSRWNIWALWLECEKIKGTGVSQAHSSSTDPKLIVSSFTGWKVSLTVLHHHLLHVGFLWFFVFF